MMISIVDNITEQVSELGVSFQFDFNWKIGQIWQKHTSQQFLYILVLEAAYCLPYLNLLA